MDEQFDVDAFAVRVQRIGHHLADRNLAEIHRGTDIQRPQVLGMQGEAFARLAISDGWRVFQTIEVLGASIVLADISADVIA
ncbi:hypothetical protein D3C86_1516730 [compost metagenome]